MTKTLTLGVNRGKPRLWLEGAWLAGLGFTAKETRYDLVIFGDVLRIVAKVDGPRRVSGKGDRPIIDICGDQLKAFAGVPLTLTAESGRIVITRGEA